ncbi:hypothetical protein [Sediminitomix flava]|uniref:Uncharacterized protein n=1 Tax=Sediminitomix flava TaxID=379075 RepID=A0A315ZB09_SEDFL|nr:hypothetical protein [Sediminitomix flava]PWJ41904.1 hypothetical protein BC781_103154 [Sediminitomix flava]
MKKVLLIVYFFTFSSCLSTDQKSFDEREFLYHLNIVKEHYNFENGKKWVTDEEIKEYKKSLYYLHNLTGIKPNVVYSLNGLPYRTIENLNNDLKSWENWYEINSSEKR